MIDTHCHLYWGKDSEKIFDEKIKNAEKIGVKKFINVGCDFETTEQAFQQANKKENIFFSSGFHPAYDLKNFENEIEKLETFLKNPKCKAVGECGFDFYHKKKDDDEVIQEKVFILQINLAKKYGKPLIIHTRNAGEKVLDILEQENYSNFVIHCFSEDLNFAKRVEKMGAMISVGGILTYKNTEKILEAVKYLPMKNIMLETDSPFLTPFDKKGKKNEPAFIKEVLIKLSEIKDIEMGEIEKITDENAEKFFGI